MTKPTLALLIVLGVLLLALIVVCWPPRKK